MARAISRSTPSNVVLVGMPGSGKSTVGAHLAALLNWQFIDTDQLLIQQQNAPLWQLIAAVGSGSFQELEAQLALTLRGRHLVIATGGSMVYSDAAMTHLRELGAVIYLRADPATLTARAGDLAARGVLHAPGESLQALNHTRAPLYERYADLICDANATVPDVCQRIIDGLALTEPHQL